MAPSIKSARSGDLGIDIRFHGEEQLLRSGRELREHRLASDTTISWRQRAGRRTNHVLELLRVTRPCGRARPARHAAASPVDHADEGRALAERPAVSPGSVSVPSSRSSGPRAAPPGPGVCRFHLSVGKPRLHVTKGRPTSAGLAEAFGNQAVDGQAAARRDRGSPVPPAPAAARARPPAAPLGGCAIPRSGLSKRGELAGVRLGCLLFSSIRDPLESGRLPGAPPPKSRVYVGTSMASPFVAGVVGLMLQIEPTSPPPSRRHHPSHRPPLPAPTSAGGRRRLRPRRRRGVPAEAAAIYQRKDRPSHEDPDLPVGTGDCLLLETADGTTLLVDGGLSTSYGRHVAPRLAALQKPLTSSASLTSTRTTSRPCCRCWTTR